MSKQEKLKAVLVGCGGISGAWLKPMQTFYDVEIAGLVDIEPAKAQSAKEAFKLDRATTGSDLAQAIESTGAQVVFNCTVPSAHAQVTMEALSHKCHVLQEKPLADSMENARLMLEAAKRHDRIFAVIQNRRYKDNIVRFRNFLQSGALGPPTTLNADFYLGCHFGGFRDEMEHVLLHDMAIHSFDEARFISGKDAASVYCHEWNPAGSWYRNGASAMTIFEMTDGVVFTYRGSWCAEGLNTSWECEWRAVCQGGSATWDGNKNIAGQKVAGTEGFTREFRDIDVPDSTPLQLTGHAALIREFLDCVRTGGTPQTAGTDNIKSFAMVCAAVESAETGRKVKVQL